MIRFSGATKVGCGGSLPAPAPSSTNCSIHWQHSAQRDSVCSEVVPLVCFIRIVQVSTVKIALRINRTVIAQGKGDCAGVGPGTGPGQRFGGNGLI